MQTRANTKAVNHWFLMLFIVLIFLYFIGYVLGLGTPKKLSIPCKSLICKGFFFFRPSPSHPSASMVKPSDDSKYLVKKLCRDFDRTSERNRRFCAIGATKTRHPLAERHLWCCDRASFELRKASYRTTKDHLSTCETCLTARGNVRRGASNEQPQITKR